MADLTTLSTSNAWTHLGMTLVRDQSNRIGVRIKNEPHLRQMHGTMHGGIVASAMDASAGAAVNEAIGDHYTASTVELKVNYLLPVTTDLTAYATLVKKGKNLIVTTIDALDENHNLVAVGLATFMVKPK